MPVGSITATVAILKEAGAALQAAGKIDLWNKVVALQAQLIDSQAELVSKDEQIAAMNKEKQLLVDKLAFSDRMIFQGHWYFANDERHAYCMACWDKNRSAVHLQEVGQVISGLRKDCPVCKSVFIDPSSAVGSKGLGSIRIARG